jgi:exodeoxyribonuclease X
MIEISKTPSIIRTFKFGKYNGQKIEDVVKVDRGYLEWLLKQKSDALKVEILILYFRKSL